MKKQEIFLTITSSMPKSFCTALIIYINILFLNNNSYLYFVDLKNRLRLPNFVEFYMEECK